jgi:hypothetical protein
MTVSIVAMLLPLLLVGVPAVAVVLVIVVATRRPAPEPSEAAAAARQHAAAVNAMAWVTLAVLGGMTPFLLVPLVTAASYTHGPAAVGLPTALVGLAFLAVHAVGEVTWPRPTGVIRRAHLSPRTTPRGPRWLWRLTWAWAWLLLVTLVAAGVTSSDGRTLTVRYAANAVQSAGPYPGWRYGVPLLIAAALLVGATEGVLRLIGRRPAVVDTDPVYDAASRQLSAHRAVRGTQLVLALTESVVLVVTGTALGNLDRVPAGAGLGVLATVVALVGVVAAVIPAQPAAQAETRPQPVLPPSVATAAEPTPTSHSQP